MDSIWTPTGTYRRSDYADEAALERAILEVQDRLFGPDRIYLDVKTKIGVRGGQRNIPDGYLIDLHGGQPRLYVVENELASHDPLRHVAVQILQFSLSFESDRRLVQKILLSALQKRPSAMQLCQNYVSANKYRNLDHLMDALVFDTPFTALIIIDDLEDLETVLTQKFQFGIEFIELKYFVDDEGNHAYTFEPFLDDVVGQIPHSNRPSRQAVDPYEIDTIIVPARAEGFERVFLGEHRWYAIRTHGSMRSQIKYIAAYQVAPQSAITHIAPVRSIEPWQDSGKWCVNFSEPAKTISPITLADKGKVRPVQSLRYASRKRLENARTLDDVWPSDDVV